MNMKKSIAAVSAGAMAISAMATVASANLYVHPANEDATRAREQIVLTYDLAQYVAKFKPTQVRTVTTYYGDEYFINGLDIDQINWDEKAKGRKYDSSKDGSEYGYTVVLGGKLNKAPAPYYLQTVELKATSMDHGNPSANGDQITGIKTHNQVWYSRATLGKDISDMQNEAVCVEDNLERVNVIGGKSGNDNKYDCEYGFEVEFNTADHSRRGDFILTDFKASVNYGAAAANSAAKYHTYDFDNAFRVTHGKKYNTSLGGKDKDGVDVPFIGSDLSGSGKWAAESYEIVATVNWENVNAIYTGDILPSLVGGIRDTLDTNTDLLDGNQDGTATIMGENFANKLTYNGTIITPKNINGLLGEKGADLINYVEEKAKTNDNDFEPASAKFKAPTTLYLIKVGDDYYWEIDAKYAKKNFARWSGLDQDETNEYPKAFEDPMKVEGAVLDDGDYDEESSLATAGDAIKTAYQLNEAEFFVIEINDEKVPGRPVIVPKYTNAPMFTYYIVYTGDENDPASKFKTLTDNVDTTTLYDPKTGAQSDAKTVFGTTMDKYTTWARELKRTADWDLAVRANGDTVQTIADYVADPHADKDIDPDIDTEGHIYYNGNGYEYVNHHFGVGGYRDNWDVPVVSKSFVDNNPEVIVARENNTLDVKYYRHYNTTPVAGKGAQYVQKYSFQTYTVTCTYTVNITDWDNQRNYTGSEGTNAGDTKFDALHNGIRTIEDATQKATLKAQREAMEAALVLSESNRAYTLQGAYADLLKYDTLTTQQNYRGSTAVSVTTGAQYYGSKPMKSSLSKPADVIWWLNQKKEGGKFYTSPVTVLNDVIGNNEEVSFRFISSAKRIRNTAYLDVKGWRKMVDSNGNVTYTISILNPVTKETEVRIVDSKFSPADSTTLLNEFEGFVTEESNPTCSWYNPVFNQHLYGNASYSNSLYGAWNLNTNEYGYPLTGPTTDGADQNGVGVAGAWTSDVLGTYGSYNYGGWNSNLFNGGLVINSNWTMQINDTKHFDWGDNSLTFFWAEDLTKDVKTHASNFLVSMLLYTPVDWYWDTLEVGVGAAAAENVAKVDTGAGQEDDGAEVADEGDTIEEEEFEDFEEEPEEEYFEDFEEEPEEEETYEDEPEEEEYYEDEPEEEEYYEETEEEPEVVVTVQEVPSPKTGNSPIALAVIPVALAAAAIVAKKKND